MNAERSSVGSHAASTAPNLETRRSRERNFTRRVFARVFTALSLPPSLSLFLFTHPKRLVTCEPPEKLHCDQFRVIKKAQEIGDIINWPHVLTIDTGNGKIAGVQFNPAAEERLVCYSRMNPYRTGLAACKRPP